AQSPVVADYRLARAHSAGKTPAGWHLGWPVELARSARCKHGYCASLSRAAGLARVVRASFATAAPRLHPFRAGDHAALGAGLRTDRYHGHCIAMACAWRTARL